MTEETARAWLVERSYGRGENLVTLVYATSDGERQVKKQLSHQMLLGREITAGQDVPVERLERVDDEETRERYRAEARRMAGSHDHDETV